jgi:hypothetical protein
MTENDCPVCGGLALNDSSGYVGNPTGVDSKMGFSRLTCNYGNPLSGNSVSMNIDCFQDAEVAKKWYQYYRKEIPYPYPETGYGSATSYSEHTQGHRVSPVANWGGDPKNSATFKSAYQDWDYASKGRYMAEIQSVTPTDTITQNEASAINVRRIQQFAGCFASFAPGGVQQASQQTLRGTIIATDLPYGKPQPLKYALVSYIRDDGRIDRTNTNDKGEYSFDALLLPGNTYTINITLTYALDKDYFTLG